MSTSFQQQNKDFRAARVPVIRGVVATLPASLHRPYCEATTEERNAVVRLLREAGLDTQDGPTVMELWRDGFAVRG